MDEEEVARHGEGVNGPRCRESGHFLNFLHLLVPIRITCFCLVVIVVGLHRPILIANGNFLISENNSIIILSLPYHMSQLIISHAFIILV